MKKLLFIIGMFLSINANAMTFYAIEDGEIYGYFAGATAGYDSKLSLSINGIQSDAFIHNHLSVSGDQVSFGYANAGDTIVFNLKVLTTGDTFYSLPSLNPDGLDHIRHAKHGGFLFVGFEDLLGGGDEDFDDHNGFFTNISAVPEPEAYMMALVGMLLIAFSARPAARNMTNKNNQITDVIWSEQTKKEAKQEVAFFVAAVVGIGGTLIAINF